MTIRAEDRDRYQSTAAEFSVQPEADSCFPTALKNIFDEFANRKDEPGMRYSISEIADALDYVEHRASASDRLASRLDPLLVDYGYEINVMTGAGYDQLQTIIDSGDRSLPLCELHEQYFEDVGELTEGYTPEPGMDGFGRWPHVVIPFRFNDDTVLYFDPYIQFFHNLDELDESGALEAPYQLFNEWWSRPEKRWSLWVEPVDQMTLEESHPDE